MRIFLRHIYNNKNKKIRRRETNKCNEPTSREKTKGRREKKKKTKVGKRKQITNEKDINMEGGSPAPTHSKTSMDQKSKAEWIYWGKQKTKI